MVRTVFHYGSVFGVKIRDMPKKTAERIRPVPAVAIPDTPAAKLPAQPAADDSAVRLTLPLTNDATAIDWSKIRESRRQRTRDILSNSGVQPAPTPAGAKHEPLLNAAMCATLYDLLAQIEALAAARVFGVPTADAFAALQFTEAEKALLADPTARVLEKYLPASLLDKYADELLLLMMLGTMTRTKIAKVQDLQGRHVSRTEVKRDLHKIPTENGPSLREIVAP